MAMPTYTYNENTPQASDKINTTQSIILSNFQAINELVGENHVGFNTDGFGKHETIELKSLGSVSGGDTPTFVTDNGIFNLNFDSGSGHTDKDEVYVHKQTLAGTQDIPFTASILSTTATASCTNGWTYLPSGLILRWGSKDGPVVASTTLSIDTASISGGPALTKALCAIVSEKGGSGSTPFYCIQTGLSDPGVINVKCSSAISSGSAQAIKYFLIGV